MPLTSDSQQNSGSRRSPMTRSLSPTTPSSRSSFAPRDNTARSRPRDRQGGRQQGLARGLAPTGMQHVSTALRSSASRSTTSRCPAALSSALRWPTSRSTARRSPAARSTTPFARPLRWALHEATPAASPRRLPTPHSSAQKSPTTFIYKKVVADIAPPRGHATRFVCTKIAGSTFDHIKVYGSTVVRAKVTNSAFDFTKNCTKVAGIKLDYIKVVAHHFRPREGRQQRFRPIDGQPSTPTPGS